jgi:hypothetical protein
MQWKRLNLHEFRALKQMTILGIPLTRISKTSGRSYQTVWNIKHSSNYRTYEKRVRASVVGHRIQRAPSNGEHRIAFHVQPQVVDVLQETNRLLGQLVRAWEASPRALQSGGE